MRHVKELAPLIYTPTVGQACVEFGHQFKRPRGMYFSASDAGEMNAMVQNCAAIEVHFVYAQRGRACS